MHIIQHSCGCQRTVSLSIRWVLGFKLKSSDLADTSLNSVLCCVFSNLSPFSFSGVIARGPQDGLEPFCLCRFSCSAACRKRGHVSPGEWTAYHYMSKACMMCPWWTGEACAMGPQVTCEIVYSPNQRKLWQVCCGVCPVNVSMTGCACAVGRALPPPLFSLSLSLPSPRFL